MWLPDTRDRHKPWLEYRADIGWDDEHRVQFLLEQPLLPMHSLLWIRTAPKLLGIGAYLASLHGTSLQPSHFCIRAPLIHLPRTVTLVHITSYRRQLRYIAHIRHLHLVGRRHSRRVIFCANVLSGAVFVDLSNISANGNTGFYANFAEGVGGKQRVR